MNRLCRHYLHEHALIVNKIGLFSYLFIKSISSVYQENPLTKVNGQDKAVSTEDHPAEERW
ncbi:unnamed protein product [Eruca vesicaria subsp. sativa]|uniref:Uncharacterized protein n=1 Tax=Eruca vesicaria subsp. sativa TaxID=29727 RepID=A0ABC8KBM8_ERUVS|nr:unnamed protein product [Eruca vesicaria subsp. sativa]